VRQHASIDNYTEMYTKNQYFLCSRKISSAIRHRETYRNEPEKPAYLPESDITLWGVSPIPTWKNAFISGFTLNNLIKSFQRNLIIPQ
jgi:hypothetical protein